MRFKQPLAIGRPALAALCMALAAAGAYAQSATGTAGASGASKPAAGAPPKAQGGKPAAGAQPPAAGRRFGAPAAVTVSAVTLQDVPVNLQAIGSVVALNQVALRAEVSARVQRVVVREGQRVAAGALLFELDDSRVRADLERLQAQLKRSQATLDDLSRQLARSEELRAKNFIAPSATETVASQVKAQTAQVNADQAAVASQELLLQNYRIRAPFAGTVGAVSVSPGALVSTGSSGTALANLVQTHPIAVQFKLPERELGMITRAGPGAPVSAKPPFGPDANQTIQGQLRFIDNSIDTASGTITVKAELPNQPQTLWPGQLVPVTLDAGTLRQVAVINQAAVLLAGKQPAVYVVRQGKAVRQPVQVMRSLGEQVALQGLKTGDQVVIQGRDNVRPGAAVRVVSTAAATE